MKKLFILLFIFLLALSLCGCRLSLGESETGSVPSEGVISSSDEKTPALEEDKNGQASVPDVESDENETESSKITEEEAIEIASKHWGIKSGDKDEKKGFSFLIMPVERSNGNIKIALKWLVNNQNYSTVDMIEIDPDTGEIVNPDTEE